MKKEIKDKWVAALRSGAYEQSIESLHTHDGFCCLGVLCDIVDKTKWKEPLPSYNEFDYEGVRDYLPNEVMGKCELSEDNPQVNLPADIATLYKISKGMHKLSNLNDRRVPFDVIAKLIEEQL